MIFKSAYHALPRQHATLQQLGYPTRMTMRLSVGLRDERRRTYRTPGIYIDRKPTYLETKFSTLNHMATKQDIIRSSLPASETIRFGKTMYRTLIHEGYARLIFLPSKWNICTTHISQERTCYTRCATACLHIPTQRHGEPVNKSMYQLVHIHESPIPRAACNHCLLLTQPRVNAK